MKTKASKEASIEAVKESLWDEARIEYPVIDDEDFDYSFDRYNCWRHMYAHWYNYHTIAFGREVARADMLIEIARHINISDDSWRSMYNVLGIHLEHYYGANSERMRRWYVHARGESLQWDKVRQGDVRRSISRAIVRDILEDARKEGFHQQSI